MTQYDRVEKRGSSLIQYGPLSSRVYLMKMAREDFPAILDDVEQIGRNNNCGKLFLKVPAYAEPELKKRGYMHEATIPQFYKGQDDGQFWAKFLDEARATDHRQDIIDDVIATAQKKANGTVPDALPDGFSWRVAQPEDAEAMVEVYKVVFASYPFPIHNPDYLRETMESHIQYFLAFDSDKLVAVSSSEMDTVGQNSEMTDFATLPDYRGRGLAGYLLARMEETMAARGDIKTVYTIARALSHGMNITFSRAGYKYGGTLINSTNIAGGMESMNVWFKTGNRD